MQIPRLLMLAAALSPVAVAQIDVGSGAPTGDISQAFVYSYLRNGFNLLVSVPPLANVARFATTGLRQEFQDTAKTTGVKYALILPNQNAAAAGSNTVWQVQGAMYAYYLTVTQGTAGYPSSDTATCPTIKSASNSGNTCQWQTFDKHYALFVYSQLLQLATQTFATRDPFYTKWLALGGINGLGPANGIETAITSSFKSAATGQTFDQGAIYNITSGTLTGRLVAVHEPVYDLYAANGGPTGSLGLPASDDLLLPSGLRRQTFEGGSIDFDPSTGIASLRPAIASILVQPGSSITMNLGDARQAMATVFVFGGTAVADRIVTWVSSNSRAVQVQPNGLSVTLKTIGAGSAVITATAEGKTSNALTVFVSAPCCQLGEGAPTAAAQQAFQDAVTRNRLSVQMPLADPVARSGHGYVQTAMTTDATPLAYLVAERDGALTAYIVSGAILAQYLALGGPSSAIGYPLSDATVGGRQLFEQGALAGNPVQLVSGSILAKWAALGYESGLAGSPTAARAGFLTFRATEGALQMFQNAAILAPTSGPLAGKVYAVAGLILTKYNASGGPGGALGAPTGDEFTTSGRRRQDFEGGYVDYAPGDASANLVQNPRQPLITATPTSVLAGSRVRLAAGGFNNNDTIRVSIAGQPDFIATVANGAYAWEVYVPANAKSGSVALRATQTSGSLTATGSYTIVALADARVTLSALGGDAQTGAPGAQLAQPLRVIVTDQNGNPVPNQAVTFAASSGASISPGTAITGADGVARASLRLPMTEGVALATAATAHQTVTFSARTAAFSLANFPAQSQAFDTKLGNGNDSIRQKGALLAAVASILRYSQQRGDLPAPNGLADTLTLNAFLSTVCTGAQSCDGFFTLGSSTDQILNLWRVGAFVGGGVDVSLESPDLNSLRDVVLSGSPVLLALALANGGGAHFVVATGIAANGSLLLTDSNPALAHATLDDYLAAQASITGAVRLLPRVPSPLGFLVIANTPPAVSSSAGTCPGLQFAGAIYFTYCDGMAGIYELDLAAQDAFAASFTDLGAHGVRNDVSATGAATLEIARAGTQWAVAPLQVNFATAGVVNAASLTADLAPGGLFSIFGAGLTRGAQTTSVTVNGVAAPTLAVLPFQINAQIPPATPPGLSTLAVSVGTSSLQQSVMIKDVAPAIFVVAPGLAAITNQDNALNTPANPASRGQAIVIYGTGFGATTASGNLNIAKTPVTAVLGGVEIPTAFAGLTPRFIGLYQVNLVVPSSFPPDLAVELFLKQGSAVSNVVTVAIQ